MPTPEELQVSQYEDLLSLANRAMWTIDLQVRRVRAFATDPTVTSNFVLQPVSDAEFLIFSLDRLLGIARQIDTMTAGALRTALGEYERALPSLRRARNVIAHLDEYLRGDGRDQSVSVGSLSTTVLDAPNLQFAGLDFDLDAVMSAGGKLLAAIRSNPTEPYRKAVVAPRVPEGAAVAAERHVSGETGTSVVAEDTDQVSSRIDREAFRNAAADQTLSEVRNQLARFTSATFAATGELLHVGGHVFGSDRVEGRSPFGHGSDETVAVSTLLRIGSELVSACADLFADGRHYAAAALLRQIVEIEYLAWAFETNDQDGGRWLRSTRSERQSFFTPSRLRNASGGRFRGKDYGYHCELGGHPVPGGTLLLKDDVVVAQLLLSDLLGHAGRIWDHIAAWARGTPYGEHIHDSNEEMAKRYAEWKAADLLLTLPPPT
ncbi:MAG TPA: hypothetical protein VG389_28235 [Myxococcota bacterium]|jgi:hypothetical protein|nr:hypothetical protein [Myxococcota bacterium]